MAALSLVVSLGAMSHGGWDREELAGDALDVAGVGLALLSGAAGRQAARASTEGRTRILLKLGVRDRVQAVILAYEGGRTRPGSG